MEVLVPVTPSEHWQYAFETVASKPVLHSFHSTIIEFLNATSRRLLLDPETRSLPELMAVAHWMRKAHLLEMKQEFSSRTAGQVRLPRGTAVHFAPSNVDSIFLYSWLLSLLMGNSNVVRVSSRRGPQLEHIFRVLNRVLEEDEFAEVRVRNLVVAYDHDEAITSALCGRCDIRAIWGGDKTIDALRRIAIPPLATDLAFADRFSLAALNANAVYALQHDELENLAQRFFNDAFWFGQAACSSPRLVAWIGAQEDIVVAKSRFWRAVEAQLFRRNVLYSPAVTMDRMECLFSLAALKQIERVEGAISDFPARALVAGEATGFRDYHRGGGLFFEVTLDVLEDLAGRLQKKDQTLCYFGFTADQLQRLAARLPARSLDRIVPVGDALSFSHIWDGVDLLDAFSRQVAVQ